MPINIALDGPGGAGKTSIAGLVAKELGILHLDTGAMYRALGLKALREHTDLGNEAAIAALCGRTDIDVQVSPGGQRTFLDGEEVSQAIRTPQVTQATACVAKVAAVRERIVALQRRLAQGMDLIMDGRDIGTQVLPDAQVKVFLTASPQERARRRHLELAEKGVPVPYEQVLEELIARDAQDSSRAASPLRQAPDAVCIDSTHMSVEAVAQAILRLVREGSA